LLTRVHFRRFFVSKKQVYIAFLLSFPSPDFSNQQFGKPWPFPLTAGVLRGAKSVKMQAMAISADGPVCCGGVP
jgi:hypothetical protein